MNARCRLLLQAAMAIVAMSVSSALAAPKCPIDYGARADAKPSELYLFYPDAEVTDPSVFPSRGFSPVTPWLPLPKFDSRTFNDYTGTDQELRDAIHDAVTDIFCEFNVQVITTTTPPPTTGKRHNIVGIGIDKNGGEPCVAEPLYGQSNTAGGDPGDSKPKDFARLWAGSYNCSNIPRDPPKWANSIAGSAAHEAGHNYGLSHEDGQGKAGDLDDFSHHLMRHGRSYSPDTRAKARHFSNFETSALARTVGLAIDTMWTMELVNPNTDTAAKLRMEVLSSQDELILSWAFAERPSPWIKPVVSGPSGTRRFNEVDYKVYQIEWSAANPQAVSPGQVPQGATFQVGATFSSLSRDDPDAVVITDVVLFDANGQALPKRPFWLGFDAGDFVADDLEVRFFNSFDQPLTLRDVKVQDLPRVMSIGAMMPNTPMTDVFNRRFVHWDRWGERPLAIDSTIPAGGDLKVRVAKREQGRHMSVQRSEKTCAETGPRGHGLACNFAITVDDLFPATTMLITATVVDPAGVKTQLFYQIAGRRARMP